MTNKTAALLAPLGTVETCGPDSCGPDLHGTLEFAALMRLCHGKPAQYVGEQLLVPAEPPPWPAVVEQAFTLLGRGKDLRVAVVLTRGLGATAGWAGLAQGLGLVRGLLERFWDHVHPCLDRDEAGPGEAGDATLRLNSLAELASDAVLADVRQLPLVSAARAGRFCLRDLAAGTPALLDAAIAEVAPAALRATADAIEDCWQGAAAIEGLLGEKLGPHALVLGRLSALLADAAAVLAPRLRAGGVDGSAGAAAVVTPALATAAAGVASRADVIRALEAICGFYRTHEPSSPIPLLLERARRLVDKSFLELVEDLTPDGLGQLNLLRGSAAQQNHAE
jgi:type VI secretion system protein ImpA